MNKANFILSLFITIVAFTLNAQTTDTLIRKSTNLSFSYMGTLKYPGVRFGIELPVKTIVLNKKKSNREKSIEKDRFFTSNIGWYHHPTFHDNVFITAGWSVRRLEQKGVFTQFSPEIGYSRTFLGGTSYSVDEVGQVSINKLAGYNHLLLLVGVGMGYDFEKMRGKPVAIYSRIHTLFMYPYNSMLYLRPSVEIGLIYKPKNFITRNVKSKIKR
jgi:hypothetical protein